MKELELNESVTVTVPAINPWFGTGLLLKKDRVYKLEVIPDTQTWSDGPKLPLFTADGKTLLYLSVMYLFIRMPSVKWFALLGCIDRKRSTYFKIGTYKEYKAEEDGELTCFANDALGLKDHWYKHNNEGVMVMKVTRIS
ncbi:MAG: hypothetical protein IAF38_12630 [Bacteroidia bacterium]|nr:hypothetical protein [Bacteroidia bacterium]